MLVVQWAKPSAALRVVTSENLWAGQLGSLVGCPLGCCVGMEDGCAEGCVVGIKVG